MESSFITTKLLNRKSLIWSGLISMLLFLWFTFKADSFIVDPVLHPTKQFAYWAFWLGGLSAISLFLGSIVGLIFTPKPSITSALTAFGAGALLAALSVELIAPTVIDIVKHKHDGHVGDESHAFYTMGSLLFGCIAGGAIFVICDELLNNRGAFLRKISTIIGRMKPATLNHTKEQIDQNVHILENPEVKQDIKEHGSAPMSIWLGLLIDGIPESFVIGAGFLTILSLKLGSGVDPTFNSIIPYTLVAGLFLSNFPEAMSSSVGMRKMGMKTGKILLLWGSMVLIIAIGSVMGYFIGAEVPHEVEVGIEGLAAGAMLTMIAQTMIPEAVHIGGPKIVGLSTLIGYLAAVGFSLFE